MGTLRKGIALVFMTILCSCASMPLSEQLKSNNLSVVQRAVIRLVEEKEQGENTLNEVIAAADQSARERIFDILTEHYVPDTSEDADMDEWRFLNAFLPVTADRRAILNESNTIRYHIYVVCSGVPLPIYPELMTACSSTPWCLGQFSGEILDKYRLKAVPYLVEALESKKSEIRMTSLLILRGILLDPYAPDYKENPEETRKQRMETWKSFLCSDNALLRVLAAGELRREMDKSELVPVVEEAYRSTDECVRFFAAQYLATWFEKKAALRTVMDAMRSSDPYIQRWALLLPARSHWYFDRSIFSDDDIEYLVGLVEGNSPRCYQALAILFQFDDLQEKHRKRIAAVIRRRIDSESAEERWSASFYLERYLALPDDFDLLVKCLQDKSEHSADIIRCAANALGELRDKRAVSHLVKLLSRKDFAGNNAAYALGTIGDTSAVPFLIEELEKRVDSRWPVALLSALEDLGDIRAVPVLLKAAQANDKNTKKDALKVLKKITNQDFGTDYAAWKAWYEKNKDK